MAIAVDNAGVCSGGTANLSFVLGGGSDRIVVVTTATISADVTDVTFDGVSMTFLDDNNTVNGNVEFWYMLDAALPVAGTYDIGIVGGESDMAKGGRSWTGVAQTSTFGTRFKANSGTGAPSVTVTGTLSTDLVIDGTSVQEGVGVDPGSGQSLGYNCGSGGAQNTTAGATEEPGSGNSVVMDWLGSADDWATIGVAMAESAAGVFTREIADTQPIVDDPRYEYILHLLLDETQALMDDIEIEGFFITPGILVIHIRRFTF